MCAALRRNGRQVRGSPKKKLTAWLQFKFEFSHVKETQCRGVPAQYDEESGEEIAEAKDCCKFFAEHYYGVGNGRACMSEGAIKRFQDAMRRPCPFVELMEENEYAAELCFLSLGERLQPLLGVYGSAVGRAGTVPAIREARNIKRAIIALQSDVVNNLMHTGEQSESKHRARLAKMGAGKQSAPSPRKPRRR